MTDVNFTRGKIKIQKCPMYATHYLEEKLLVIFLNG